jgi:hypothetical protein
MGKKQKLCIQPMPRRTTTAQLGESSSNGNRLNSRRLRGTLIFGLKIEVESQLWDSGFLGFVNDQMKARRVSTSSVEAISGPSRLLSGRGWLNSCHIQTALFDVSGTYQDPCSRAWGSDDLRGK